MRIPPVQFMHIPDGFLSVIVAVIYWIFAIIILGIALKKTSRSLGDKQLPMMGVLAAAIFAGQMLNFSITGGTSGHLLGAAIAVILFGPWPAVLIMTSVVSVQALFFQDGGILALGANIFNMAIVGVFAAFAVFTLVSKIVKDQKWSLYIGGFSAAWGSIVVAALSCALQLALSGTSPANIVIPAMAVIHILIGIVEGLITVGVLVFIYRAGRESLQPSVGGWQAGNRLALIGGSVITIALAVLSPLASQHPDGLKWVAEQHGFIQNAKAAFYNLIPDYLLPGISNPAVSKIIAGIIGVIIVFAVVFGLGSARKKSSVQTGTEG